MRRPARLALLGLLVVSAAQAAEPTSCLAHKGLYESWLSLTKRAPRTWPKLAAITSSRIAEPASAEEIHTEYSTLLQCLSDAALPADDDGGRSLCKDASADRLGNLVCQLALYVKTNRANGGALLDVLPANKKGAEMIWDLDAIAGSDEKRYPALFTPKGPAYKLIDEVFVLVLDDRETAMSKYFHIVGAAPDAGSKYTDSQIKVLLLESPMVVVKHWEVLRQYQPKLKKLLSEISTEVSGAELSKLRKGIASFCTKDNLDCPEIQGFFGRPQ